MTSRLTSAPKCQWWQKWQIVNMEGDDWWDGRPLNVYLVKFKEQCLLPLHCNSHLFYILQVTFGGSGRGQSFSSWLVRHCRWVRLLIPLSLWQFVNICNLSANIPLLKLFWTANKMEFYPDFTHRSSKWWIFGMFRRYVSPPDSISQASSGKWF